jgi:plastocyanin
MNTGFSQRRRGLLAATSALAVAAGIAVVSVAGAAQSITIYAAGPGATPCFATVANQTTCPANPSVDVTIDTGDTVTWDYTIENGYHNAYPAANGSTPPDADWDGRDPDLVTTGTDSWTFGKPGVYRFLCQAHSKTMLGTITVKGEVVETPTPEPTPDDEPDPQPTTSATPTPTPKATAVADDHTSTPAPGHASVKDTEAPQLASASVKRVSAGVQLRFWLSEPATVSIAATRKGSKKAAASATVQAAAGTRSMVLRSKAFKKGTYTVTFAPVDAMGNKGAASAKTLKVK